MRVEGSGLRVEGSGFRVQGSGFKVFSHPCRKRVRGKGRALQWPKFGFKVRTALGGPQWRTHNPKPTLDPPKEPLPPSPPQGFKV